MNKDKITRDFKYAAVIILSCLSFSVSAGLVNQNSVVTVIGYHEVTDTAQALIPNYAISRDQFLQHINFLEKNHYHFINVDQLQQAHQGKIKLPEKAILLTVDDGYESFYHTIYPIIKAKKIPVVLAVVGSWLEPAASQQVNFGGELIPRSKILSWSELKEMQDSGFVEIASHSYNLHHGIQGNPQGNLEPAATTRLYSPKAQSYETDQSYKQRIYNDLKKNNLVLQQHGLKSPRVMVWPYGRYNQETIDIAKQLGMPVMITLDDGVNFAGKPLEKMTRILVEERMTTAELQQEILSRQQNLGDNNRPQKIMHVDLDYIYDKDPVQQERNLGALLDRINVMGVNTVYLQAFSDPDANGSANMVYFPNRHIPMRADLFNRVAWQIQTRTPVSRIYAWMPLLAWEPPQNDPVAQHVVQTQQSSNAAHLNMGYHRLSPFSADARREITEIYEDLAKSASFNGLLFHDDATLSDYEDASPDALKAYAAEGFSTNLAQLRSNDQQLQKWTAFKTHYLDDFAMSLVEKVKYYNPFLMTARNLYAQVALSPYAENWYAQSLEDSIKRYDFTSIMAMPYMEQADQPEKFYQDIVQRVKQYPDGLKKTVFELQATDWRTGEKIPSQELKNTIIHLYTQGAIHVAYYPDDPIQGHPDVKEMHDAFQQKSNQWVK